MNRGIYAEAQLYLARLDLGFFKSRGPALPDKVETRN